MQGKVQVIEEIREKEASRKNHLWETDSGEDRHTRLKELVYSVLIPDEQRECLLLHWFEAMSQRDIAEKLHIPLGTIKTRLELGFNTLSELVCRDPTCCEEYQSSESHS